MDNDEFKNASTPIATPKFCNLTVLGAKDQPGLTVTKSVRHPQPAGQCHDDCQHARERLQALRVRDARPGHVDGVCANDPTPVLNSTPPLGVLRSVVFADNGPGANVTISN